MMLETVMLSVVVKLSLTSLLVTYSFATIFDLR
jgi:hypothetical protein